MKNSILDFFVLSSARQVIIVVLTAVLVGLCLTAFRLSNAFSYLSDDPRACVNCHIMSTEYATWFHSSHRERATCNDCHVPHDNIVRKYLFKASDGSRHATMFTLGLEPQVIRIKDAGKTVVQENCLRCHKYTVNPVSVANVTGRNYKYGQGLLCWECHRETPHGITRSLASAPYARIPDLSPSIPNWLKKYMRSREKN